jgi:tetratricopeptide (TPR) repeat protein
MRQIAQELGVAYILEGSVRRAGSLVRVTGQLIRAATDEHVWAKSYDKDLTSVFAIQSELSQAIASALSAALSPEEKQLLDRPPTANLAAYDAYVKARQLRGGGILSAFTQAEALLLQSVQLDPQFAAAWAELGSLHAYNFFNETDQTAERLAKAKAAIETAVKLAPDAPEVIEKLGDYYYHGYRDYARATEQYSHLAVLCPNDAVVFGSLGLIHRRQGRWADALANLRRASQLDPRQARFARNLSSNALAVGLFDEAAAAQRHAVELTEKSLPEQFNLHFIAFQARGSTHELQDWLARLPAEQAGAPDVVTLRKALALATGDFLRYVDLDRRLPYYDGFGNAPGIEDGLAAFVLAAHGDRAAAQQRASKAITDLQARLEKQPANAGFWAAMGGAYALLGNREEALRCAQKAKDLLPESRDACSGPTYSQNYAS